MNDTQVDRAAEDEANIEVVRRLLGAVADGNVDAFVGAWAPDAHLEFVFAPEGMPRELRGQDEIRGFFGPSRSKATAVSAKLERAEPLLAPGRLLVEYSEEIEFPTLTVHGRYCAIATFADGAISHWREYFDPSEMIGVMNSMKESDE